MMVVVGTDVEKAKVFGGDDEDGSIGGDLFYSVGKRRKYKNLEHHRTRSRDVKARIFLKDGGVGCVIGGCVPGTTDSNPP